MIQIGIFNINTIVQGDCIELLKKLPDDLVLDPFSGSGTTAAVAKRLGRKFLAFEREEFYIQVANDRLKKITPIEKPLLEYKIEKRKPKVSYLGVALSGRALRFNLFCVPQKRISTSIPNAKKAA